ncbi:MAG: 7-cyano-7-deazaguanine synthase QueC [Candidatus Aminicenantes bacterium]|nr:7-cyano-7-deazaguanine synthase QueC [Candidatus Aminicenantes bacterium]
MKSVVLFSGGLDSTTLIFWALAQGKEIQVLSFDYGQRHSLELELGRKLCDQLGLLQDIIKIDLRPIVFSALTDPEMDIPSFDNQTKKPHGPPATYVPFRNGIFLSLAAAWAETRSIEEILCGFHVLDSPDYPDTTESFVQAMEEAINRGTKASFGLFRFKIVCPFLKLKKTEILRLGLSLGADYSYSISCYRGQEIPCFKCPACHFRQQAWDEVGEEDHLLRRLRKEGKL